MALPAELRRQLEAIPDGSLVPIEFAREVVRELLSSAGITPSPGGDPPLPDEAPATASWRVKFWTVPAETRLGVKELCEATGKPASWCYRHCSQKSGLDLLPHRKLDGALIFLAGEVRAWLEAHERTVVRPSSDVAPIGRLARRSG